MATKKRIIALLVALCLMVSFFGTLPRAHAAESGKIKKQEINEQGTIIAYATIYTSIAPRVSSLRSFTGGEVVYLYELYTDSKGNQFYSFSFGTLKGFIEKDNVIPHSQMESHGQPGSKEPNNSNASSGKFKKQEINEQGTIIAYATIYTSIDPKVSSLRSFTGGEVVYLYELYTDSKGNQFYSFSFGTLKGFIEKDNVISHSQMESHGQPGSKEPNNSNASSGKFKKQEVKDKGTIIAYAEIYKSIDPKVSSYRSFMGGEVVYLSELYTDSQGNQFYSFSFGTLKGFIEKDNVIPHSQMESHGQPGSKEPNNSNASSGKFKKQEVKDKGTIIAYAEIYKSIAPKVSNSSSFMGGEVVFLSELYTDSQGNQFYSFSFGILKGFIEKDNVIPHSQTGSNNTGGSSGNKNSTSNNSGKIPSTKGKSSYLAANTGFNYVSIPSGKIVKGISPGTIFQCYGKCDYDSGRVWIDLDGDEKIDGSILAGSVCKVDEKAVIVSISEQKVYVLRNYKVVFSAPCITGNKGTKDTNLGVQEFIELKPGTWMTGIRPDGKPYKTWTDFWMQFNDDEEAIHNSKRRKDSDYTPYTYDGDGSYGCVNVTYNTAKTLYNKYAFLGEQVIVTNSRSSIFR